MVLNMQEVLAFIKSARENGESLSFSVAHAVLAQLVERSTCNRQAASSILADGSKKLNNASLAQ